MQRSPGLVPEPSCRPACQAGAGPQAYGSSTAWHALRLTLAGLLRVQARLTRVEQQLRSEEARRKREGFKQQVKVRQRGWGLRCRAELHSG